MLLSTILNLFFITVLYVLLQTLLSKFGGKKSTVTQPHVTPDHRLPPPHEA